MKCDQAQTWLLASDAPAVPAEAVERHLQGCADCRRMQAQLVELESCLSAGSASPAHASASDSAAKRRFLSTLADLDSPWPTAEGTPESAGTLRGVQVEPAQRSGSGVRQNARTPDSRIPRSVPLAAGLLAASILVALLTWWRPWVGSVHDDPNKAGVATHGTDKQRPDKQPGRAHPSDVPAETPRSTNDEREPNITPDNEPEAPEASQEALADLLPPCVENHVLLANAKTPGDRLLLLDGLADTLFGAISRQVKGAPSEDLQSTRDLYEHVLRDGHLSKSLLLAAEDDDARRRVAMNLMARQAEASRLAADRLPLVSELLASVSQASGDAARELDMTSSGTPCGAEFAPAQLANNSLVAACVARSVSLATEPDPLGRAEHSSEFARQLSEAIVFASLRGETAPAEELGGYLGEVVEQAVQPNLKLVDLKGADAARRERFEAVQATSRQAISMLHKNLERAPQAAKPGLERALEAQKKGSHGPHKGPKADSPRHGPGSGRIPPGLRGRSDEDLPPGLRKPK